MEDGRSNSNYDVTVMSECIGVPCNEAVRIRSTWKWLLNTGNNKTGSLAQVTINGKSRATAKAAEISGTCLRVNYLDLSQWADLA